MANKYDLPDCFYVVFCQECGEFGIASEDDRMVRKSATCSNCPLDQGDERVVYVRGPFAFVDSNTPKCRAKVAARQRRARMRLEKRGAR